MTNIIKKDGSYHKSFLMQGKRNAQDFGYYTNGYPLEKITVIQIENDTKLIGQYWYPFI